MDPKKLIKDQEYVYKQINGEEIKVLYLYETINYYTFIGKNEIIRLTPSNVTTQIYASKME